MSEEIDRSEKIRRRNDLPDLERAVSDALDEYNFRIHGIMSSWAHPVDFIRWLNEEGYGVVKIEQVQE